MSGETGGLSFDDQTPFPAAGDTLESQECRGALDKGFGVVTESTIMASDGAESALEESCVSSPSAFRLRPFTGDIDS